VFLIEVCPGIREIVFKSAFELQIEAKNAEARGAAERLVNKNMQAEATKTRFADFRNTPKKTE